MPRLNERPAMVEEEREEIRQRRREREEYRDTKGGFILDNFALEPRFYMDRSSFDGEIENEWERAQEAVEVVDAEEAVMVMVRRQDGAPEPEIEGSCRQGQHSCGDIGVPNFCCADNQFCFISNNVSRAEPRAACCRIGNDCAIENPCPTSQYLCEITATTTLTLGGSTSTSGSATTTGTDEASEGEDEEPETEIRVEGTCCGRLCDPSIQFACSAPFEGACCPLGTRCVENETCEVWVPDAPTPVASIQPTQCAQGQYPCDDGLAGCCRNGARCTVITTDGTTGYCASATETGQPTATRLLPSNFTSVREDDAGLSTGAKAGLGVGVALGVILILAITAWFLLRRRRLRTEAARSETASTALQSGYNMQQYPPEGTPTPSAATPARGRRRQGTNDYFGPSATAGPYTEGVLGEGEVEVHGHEGDGLGRGAVPVSPRGPGDIVPAVEIGGRERGVGEEDRAPGYEETVMPKESKVPETTRDRFELP